MNLFLKKIEYLLIFFIAYTLIFLTFFSTLKFTIPFILALIFSFILREPTRFLIRKLKMKGWLASLLTTSIFFILIVTGTTLLIFVLVIEISEIIKYLQNLLSIYGSDFTNYFSNIQNAINEFNIFNIDLDPKIITIIKNNLATSLDSLINGALNISTSVLESILKYLGYVPYILIATICTIISTYFFTKAISANNNGQTLKKFLPNKSDKAKSIFEHSKHMLINYTVSYMFIIFLSMAFTFIGFYILGIDFALILSIIAGILDLLPIVGMAMVYIPLAIINILNGNTLIAILILVLYGLVCLFRQIIEPKIMASSLGIHPVLSIAALFVGMQLGGFIGVIFCLFLVVSYNILKKVNII